MEYGIPWGPDERTPTSPGIVYNHFIAMLIKRLDSMDSKLARLDSIRTTVNSLHCRMNNMEKNDK